MRCRGRQVLDRRQLQLAPGEFTGLIGSNGAGKTTLVPGDPRAAGPARRAVRVAGRPRSRRNPLIGYVPQKFLLDPDLPLRARDLVALGIDGHRLGFPLPSARAAARSSRCSRRSTPSASPTRGSGSSRAVSSSGS